MFHKGTTEFSTARWYKFSIHKLTVYIFIFYNKYMKTQIKDQTKLFIYIKKYVKIYIYKICQVWYAYARNYRMQNINQRSKQDRKPYWVHMLKDRERHQIPPCWSTRSNNSYQNPNKSFCIYNPQKSNTVQKDKRPSVDNTPLKSGRKPGIQAIWFQISRGQ